ncbi:MAG: hypothetical protein CBB68_07865 [Rhodospirillaceae bacterium TMED8]|nr:hypothetical protein [Magnetovibrio sp.]OUT50893.1 MAG: hypothetical protein CBB68_07865 [Rhodospirillaceae bacterium TMED8]|tara:strand:- start:306 stop:530 length:225 start_codon:yes stop_codon:yes gene_type:complete
MPRIVLDLKGFQCPLPVVRANKALQSMASGDELEAHVTDRAAPNDFIEYCQRTGNQMVSCDTGKDCSVIVIRKV